MTLPPVAFLGLGAIGAPMAAHLAAGGRLTVWNRTAARADASSPPATVPRVAATPRDAAAAAEVVITCLRPRREVEALLDGPDGLLAGFRRGALLLDCTSGDPASSRRIAARLAERGVGFADAPVSGGTNGAEAGTLTVMVGADAGDVRPRPAGARARSAGGSSTWGRSGRATRSRRSTTRSSRSTSWRRARGWRRWSRPACRRGRALEVLNASSGRSFVSETLVPERVLTGAWPRTFRLALLDKDVGIARGLLAETGVAGPVLDLAGELLDRGPRGAGRGGRLPRADPADRAPGRRGDSRLTPTCRVALACPQFPRPCPRPSR